MKIDLSCHCGAVRISIPRSPPSVTSCNCSICQRLGSLWAYYPAHEVTIGGEPDATAAYVWGERTVAFHHCRTCGCTTHWQGLDGKAARMGVNARLMPSELLAHIRVRRLDGAKTWTYLDD